MPGGGNNIKAITLIRNYILHQVQLTSQHQSK